MGLHLKLENSILELKKCQQLFWVPEKQIAKPRTDFRGEGGQQGSVQQQEKPMRKKTLRFALFHLA